MKNKHLLIIEDRIEESQKAIEIAESKGLETRLAQNFSSALLEIKEHTPLAIASDLFFPSGNINQEKYLSQILPTYENHLKGFRPHTTGPLVEVLKYIFPDRGKLTKEEFFDQVIMAYFLKNSSEVEIEVTRDAYFGIQNYSRYVKLQKHIEEVKQGKNVPYGIFVVQEARKLGIPVHIVTSTNHHDVAFEPIRSQIGHYSDELISGHKSWAQAFDYLITEVKGGK